MIKNKDIICISSMNYEEHLTGKQQIMKILAKHNRVFYFQREIGLEHIIKHPQMLLRFFKKKIYIKNKIIIINTPLLLPGRYYSHIINNLNQKYLSIFIKKIIRKFNIYNPIIWTFQPHSAVLMKNLQSDIKIYHCAENYNVVASGRKKKIMQEQENELCKTVDYIFCVTKGIYDKMNKICPEKSYIVYNGVDYELYKKAADNLDEPEDIKQISQPRLLHMGMVNGKVNFDLFIYLATRNPDWNFVFVGDIFYSDINIIKFNKLNKLNNIYFLGKKEVDLLPNYLSNIDVCLIAGKKNEWTKITKPLKCYEYLASGKPIVSFGFPELKGFDDFIYIAEDFQEYENHINSILQKKIVLKSVEQIKFAEKHSWENRLNQIANIINYRSL